MYKSFAAFFLVGVVLVSGLGGEDGASPEPPKTSTPAAPTTDNPATHAPTTNTPATHAPTTNTPTASPTTPKPAELTVDTYNITQKDKTMCLIVRMALQMKVTYNTTEQKPVTSFINLPPHNDTIVSDTSACGVDQSNLDLIWQDRKWKFSLNFRKDDKEFHMTDMIVVFDKISDYFPDILEPKQNVTSMGNVSGINADIGNYYQCEHGQDVTMSQDLIVHLEHVKAEAFHNATVPFHGKAQQCKADVKTNNIVPIAVGAALAGLVLIVLIAYIIGRNRNRSGYESV